jgi:hypothetical protein
MRETLQDLHQHVRGDPIHCQNMPLLFPPFASFSYASF